MRDIHIHPSTKQTNKKKKKEKFDNQNAIIGVRKMNCSIFPQNVKKNDNNHSIISNQKRADDSISHQTGEGRE